MLLVIILLVAYLLFKKITDKGADELGVVPNEVPSYGEGNVDASSKLRLKINFFR